MLTILTRSPNPFKAESIKYFTKKVLGRNRGPEAVCKSLVRGLRKNHVHFKLNPIPEKIMDEVIVLSGIESLKWGIFAKKNNRIKKLIAGPNIVVTPNDYGGIIKDPCIDRVIVPAQWVADFYVHEAPELNGRISTWAAGVELPPNTSVTCSGCIVYMKNAACSLSEEIFVELDRRKITYTLLEYGTFNQREYYKRLSTAKFMIYLGGSESQGLAIHEAWIRNVPTLVFNPGEWTYKNYTWKDVNIAAPYLTNETGMFFSKNFTEKLDYFIESLPEISPREHSRTYFTDEVCAQNLIELISRI